MHIKKNMAQMSCKFGEIIKKPEAVGEMSQTKPLPKRPTPSGELKWRVFSAGFPRGDSIRQNYPPFWPAIQDGKNRGEGGVICGLI